VDPVGRHAGLFNQGVRTGDFGAWLATFAEDADVTFDGLPIPPAHGRDAIAAVYAAHPPSSPMRVVSSSVDGDVATGRFVWVAAPDTGGQFVLHLSGARVTALNVTLDAPPPPPMPPRTAVSVVR
jgi:SnoaL-like domain